MTPLNTMNGGTNASAAGVADPPMTIEERNWKAIKEHRSSAEQLDAQISLLNSEIDGLKKIKHFHEMEADRLELALTGRVAANEVWTDEQLCRVVAEEIMYVPERWEDEALSVKEIVLILVTRHGSAKFGGDNLDWWMRRLRDDYSGALKPYRHAKMGRSEKYFTKKGKRPENLPPRTQAA